MIDNNALKFKTKSLEHMDLMRRVYEGATTTGKFAWTPGAAFEPVAIEDNLLLVDEEDYEDSSEEDTPVTVHVASSAIHADDTPTSGESKRKFNRITHPQRKKGQSEGASLLAMYGNVVLPRRLGPARPTNCFRFDANGQYDKSSNIVADSNGRDSHYLAANKEVPEYGWPINANSQPRNDWVVLTALVTGKGSCFITVLH
ncbi:unnamed protein product [Camellia sinensis]